MTTETSPIEPIAAAHAPIAGRLTYEYWRARRGSGYTFRAIDRTRGVTLVEISTAYDRDENPDQPPPAFWAQISARGLVHDGHVYLHTADDLRPAEPRYRLWTAGGHLSLLLIGTFTADGLRGRLLRDPGKGMVRRADVEVALEVAIAAGSGRGSHGLFSHGTAAGAPILRWRIERVDG